MNNRGLMNNRGFIMLPRCFMESELFNNKLITHFYILLLYQARYKNQVIDGIFVKENQMLITKKALSEMASLSEREVRYYLNKFRDMGAINYGSVKNQYTLITLNESFLDGTFALKLKQQEPIFYPEIKPYEKKEKKTEKKEKANSNIGLSDDNTSVLNSDEALSSDKKLPYGKFRNVLLTAEEFKELQQLTPDYEYYIERLSASLMNTSKTYNNHFALLYKNILEDMEKNRLEKKSEIITPDPTASYDIRRAEERARTSVPKLRKREKR